MPGLRCIRRLGLLVFLPLLILVGCGGPKETEVTVTGVVKYKGQPLTGGTISFFSVAEKDKVARTGINSDGTYIAGKVPVGDVKIAVDGPGKPSDSRLGTSHATIPTNYRKPDTSGLTWTVTSEANQTHDIDLK
jgi:hypothetical protein